MRELSWEEAVGTQAQSYATESGLRGVAASSPTERASSAAYERSPANLRELDAAIAGEKNPSTKALLVAERKTQTQQAPKEPVLRELSWEEATGSPIQPSFGGFLRDKQSWKDMGKGAAAILDLGLGMPAFAGTVLAAGLGNIIEATRGDITPMGTTNLKIKTAIEKTPWMKFLLAPLTEGFKLDTSDTLVGKGMEGLASYVDEAAAYWTKKTGDSEVGEALKQAVNIAMFKGHVPVKGAIEGAAKLASLVKKKQVLPAAEAPAAKTPEAVEAKQTVDEYMDQVLGLKPLEPASPTAQAANAVAKPAPAVQAPKAEPGGEIDPYKVAGAAGLGAAAWALQEQLTDEQLASVGLLGAAAITRLDGVPEANLIAMMRQGGKSREAAAAQIYRDNVPALTRSLRKYEQKGIDIEDAVQRTMENGLKAIENGQFTGGSALRTYLYRIAENEALGDLRYTRARPRTEPLDQTERPGIGRDDAAQPSLHEQVADESLLGRSPEQMAINKALGEKMSAALESLPEERRRIFEMSELEGRPDAEIAKELGVPVGTVKSNLSRAREDLQRRLREYGPKAALAAGAVGVAALADEEELAALGGAAAMGAVKGKGGMWHPEAATRLRVALSSTLGNNTQATRMVEGYLNKHAGTATDPLKDTRLPSGERWEDITDALVVSKPAADKLLGARPDEPIWNINNISKSENITKLANLRSYLEHVGQYLQANVPRDKLPQYDLVRAVKETAKWDADMAKAAEKARLRENDVALQRMETMTVEMEFPDGMKLVKLDKPGDFAHESTVMGHSVRGYEPWKEQGYVSRVPGDPEPYRAQHPDWIPESEKGESDSRFGSGHPNYGLGGWEAIKNGQAKVLSLRDAKGESHVTIEIAEFGTDPFPPRVTQIKGRGNAPVTERYQQQIADYLNSRKWGEVRDLENAGLVQGKAGYFPLSALERTPGGAARAPARLPNQAGSASPAQLFTLAAATAGGSLGAFLDEESPLRAGFYGALAGGLMASAAGRSLVKRAIASPDYALGLTSTRLGNINPELKARYRDHSRRVLKALDTTYDQVTPFLTALRDLPSGIQELVARDLWNGKADTIQATPALRQTFPRVRATLDNIEGQLKALGRFGEGVVEYFPRIVKDYKGLKAALSQPVREGLERTLAEAEANMMRTKQRALTDVEQSLVTNRYLFSPGVNSQLPGFARGRKIGEVTEALQAFYEPPAESLLRYLSGSINDIEMARFFGRDIKVNAKGEKKFTSVDDSIGELTARLMREKGMTAEQARTTRGILQARFVGGEKFMNETLATVRDLTNASLLGNVIASATQLGDSFMTIYHFGLTPTLQALGEKLRGTSRMTPKDLGILNHVAEELSGQRLPGTVLAKSLQYSGFTAIDRFAKGLGINAALIQAQRMASTPTGRVKLAERYGYAFEGEMPQLIADLRTRANTQRTQRLAFEALSDAQPISKAEMPQAYLEYPNGRLLYQLKTYMLKQGDIVRRDAYQNIVSGDPKKLLIGARNLAALATVYALAGVPSDVVKDWISGREADPLSTPKMVENVLQTFGLNRYAQDRLSSGKVVDTARDFVTPPLKVLEDIALGREKAVAYIPGVGRPVYDRFLGGNEKREIAETILENRGVPKGYGKKLSDKAQEYSNAERAKAREKREERDRKWLERQ